MSSSLLDAAFDWIGDGAGRPKYCMPFDSRPTTTHSFGDPDGTGVFDSLLADPAVVPLRAPVNGMLWTVPASLNDPDVLPHWPRLRRVDGSAFGPRENPAVLAEHDLLLETWPAAFRRLEYVFSSLEVPTSFAEWDLPQMPAPRWFWFRGVGDMSVRAQAIATAQLGSTVDITKFSQGRIPLYVNAGDRLTTAADPIEIRVFDSQGLVMDPDFVFATFRELADGDFKDLCIQDPGSITWAAPQRQIIVVSDAAGKPYVSVADPDSETGPVTPPRELTFPNGSSDTVDVPQHGVVVVDGMPVSSSSPLVDLELAGDEQRLSLSPHGTLAKRIKASLSTRSFLRMQVTDFAAWFPGSANPRNKTAGSDAFERYTDGNEVIPLIDGKEMLRAVYRAMRATHVLENYDSDDHVPALDPNATVVLPHPDLKARARILLTNAWIHPHTAMLGRRAQIAAPRTQEQAPPTPDSLVQSGFRVVPVFLPSPVGSPPNQSNTIMGSDALSDYRMWVLMSDNPLPPGTFVGLRQTAISTALKGDDPNLPGLQANADLYGVVAPLGSQATSWAFAGTTGFVALTAFYKDGEPSRGRLQVVSWTPDPNDSDPSSLTTSGKGTKRVRSSGDADLPNPPSSAVAAPAIPARLEFDGTPGRAVVVIDPGALPTSRPVVVINTHTGEVHGEVLGPNNTTEIRIPVEPFALRDRVLLGFGNTTAEPKDCDWFWALKVSDEQAQAGGAVGHPTEVLGAVQESMLAGVDARLLAWRGYDVTLSGAIFGATGMVAAVNAGVGGHRGQAIHDELARRESAVHHQKGAFIRTAKTVAEGGGVMAFVGGIDLMSSRWDIRRHDQVEPDRQSDPWHDLHCRVRGKAAWDVYRNFRQRWNAALQFPAFTGGTDPGWTPVPAIDDTGVFEPGVTALGSVTMADGPCTVQINRTLAPYTPTYNSFLNPDFGDLSVEKSYHHAIAAARRFVYIEDQYFWNQDMAQRLHNALFENRIEFVMLLLPKDLHEKETADLMLYAQRRRNLSILMYGAADAGPGGPHDVAARVAVFGIVNDAREPIYVHCKMMVVDDIWCSISSSNLSRRSMTYDSEIGAMSIDKRTRRGGQRLARDLRIDLMAAHLGLAPEERPLLEDPYQAFRLFKDYLEGRLTARTYKIEDFAIAKMDPLHTHYGIQPADADGTFTDGLNWIADPDGHRDSTFWTGLVDLTGLFDAMDQATPGNVFGGMGTLRVTFDVHTVGNPSDIVVAVSVLEDGQPESSRVTLGVFPAAGSVNAGIVQRNVTYRVRGIASLAATPNVELARKEMPVATPTADTSAVLAF